MPVNPESRRAAQRRYQEKNREKINEKRRGNPHVLAQKRADYRKRREAILAKQRAEYPEKREKKLAAAKQWRLRNPEKRKQDHAAYYEAHKEERKEKDKAYAEKNREKIRIYQRGYRQRNRHKKPIYQSRYQAKNSKALVLKLKLRRQAHPEILAAQQARRRAHKLNAPINDFTREQWQEMQEAYDHRCAYCGKRAKGKLTQDHITPLSKGGSHTASNIVPACKSCNSRKNAGAPLVPVQPLLLTLAPPKERKTG